MDQRNRDKDPEEPRGWIDRHLGKIVVAAALFCGAALVGRALTG
jgi:hypothetical protein